MQSKIHEENLADLRDQHHSAQYARCSTTKHECSSLNCRFLILNWFVVRPTSNYTVLSGKVPLKGTDGFLSLPKNGCAAAALEFDLVELVLNDGPLLVFGL